MSVSKLIYKSQKYSNIFLAVVQTVLELDQLKRYSYHVSQIN